VTSQTEAHQYLLRATGSVLIFAGYTVVYQEAKDEDLKPDDEEGARLPADLSEGQAQRLMKLLPEQHFTQPPPRFTEATLVRSLEENGIGRPSTYAPILATLQARGYVTRTAKRLSPTETGVLVNDLLLEHFPDILDVGFTAEMEARLDQIAAGELPWVKVISDFYAPFAVKVGEAEENIPNMNLGPEPIGRDCPECQHELVIRWGRYGKFISCSNFPDCRYTEPWLKKIGVQCHKDGGEIVMRKTRKGRVFYGCANYPEFDFTSWKLPLAQPCPQCGGLLVVADKQNAQCTECEERFPLEIVAADETADAA
jgi:DNA topoisomerase-1